FQLKALEEADLLEAARRAIADSERGYGKWRVRFEEGALEHLVETANGDARSLLNALELAIETSPDKWPPPEGSAVTVSFAAAEESIQKKAVLYDRDGDYHYDTISAFIKSVRGSDPDAALYWMAKMIRAGESPDFIFRRMLISAGEDVGMADPNAIVVVQACAATFDRIGLPEGHFPLAQAALYLATAPKSNTTLAFFDALKAVEKEDSEIPNHLRDDHRDKEGFGHGDGYIYPHAYREHWAAQQYLPKSLAGRVFYVPSELGFEARIRDEVLRKREIQAAVVLAEADEDDGEVLTYSASSQGREGWLKRLESGRAALLTKDRDALFAAAKPVRHHRILVETADDGLLLWEAVRRVPEGLAAGIVRDEQAREALMRYAEALDENERPIVMPANGTRLPSPAEAERAFGTGVFDVIVSREPWKRGFGEDKPATVFAAYAAEARELLAPGGVACVIQSIPGRGERVSRVLSLSGLCSEDLIRSLSAAEEKFYSTGKDPRLAWDAEDAQKAFNEAGFETTVEMREDTENRILSQKEIDLWFDVNRSSWGSAVSEKLGDEMTGKVRGALASTAERGPVAWRRTAMLLKARRRSTTSR
ncbi:MAG: AAA family ATPase, partial [Treponemataceae bacterium]